MENHQTRRDLLEASQQLTSARFGTSADVFQTAAQWDEKSVDGMSSVLGSSGKPQNVCSTVPTIDLLQELSRRGGHPGALADAALLCVRKSQDYNHGQSVDPHTVDRTAYFPFGAVSYAQMLHTKSERFCSITKKNMGGGKSNFEGLHDTALDIINYAGFFLADKRLK